MILVRACGGHSMIDKRFWSSAIAIVTLIVAGASALPELLLRPASTAPTVVLPLAAPKAKPMPEQTAAPPQSAPMPAVNHTERGTPTTRSIATAPPQPAAPDPEKPKAAPLPAATLLPPAPVSFPPVQPLGDAAANVPSAIPAANPVPPARPPGIEANRARPDAEKPVPAERIARRPDKPIKSVRPAAYPIGEFLAWRR